jgi:hypothetical protein
LDAFTSYFEFAYFRNYIRKAGASAVILASENSTIQPIRNRKLLPYQKRISESLANQLQDRIEEWLWL